MGVIGAMRWQSVSVFLLMVIHLLPMEFGWLANLIGLSGGLRVWGVALDTV